MLSALEIIRAFYDARARDDDDDSLRRLIADDVRWIEPEVGHHRGDLHGVEAVMDMFDRAQAATDGKFSCAIVDGVEVVGHCSIVVRWTAKKNGQTLSGRELATFTVDCGKITFAQFLPENLRDDEAFWG